MTWRSLPMGRYLEIPVRASWSVAVAAVAGAVVLATGVLPRIDAQLSLTHRLIVAGSGVVLFLLSILAHEFGHALTAKRHGISTSSIRLWIFGGVAALSAPARTPVAEFQIAAAGPAVNAALAAVFGLLGAGARSAGLPDGVVLVPSGLALLNVLLVVTNLIPAAPLDGGRVLTSVLWARTGRPEWARLQSARSGLLLGLAVTAFGFWELIQWNRASGLYTAAIGVFLGVAARSEVVTAAVRRRLAATTVGEVLLHHPGSIPDRMLLVDVTLGPAAQSLPVCRWTPEPIGYLSTAAIHEMAPHHRAWTTAGSVMVRPELVPRAWTSESLLAALERHGTEPSQLLGVDPESGRVVGTATPDQFRHLMARPGLWGNDRDPHHRPQITGAWTPTGP